jgi:YHS domain-containing protein
MGAAASDFPAADSVLGELDLNAVARGADSWAIVASMGHYDEEALACVLGAEPALEVGLVASRRRARSVVAALRDQGIDEAQLSRIRTPAGGERAIVTLRSARSKARPAAPVEIQGFAEDPVCHMSVDIKTATHTATHEGRTYYFCCAGCKAQFEADTESTERP